MMERIQTFVRKYAAWALVAALLIAGLVGYFFPSEMYRLMQGSSELYQRLFYAGIATAGVLLWAHIKQYSKMVALVMSISSVAAMFVILNEHNVPFWSIPFSGAALIFAWFMPQLFKK